MKAAIPFMYMIVVFVIMLGIILLFVVRPVRVAGEEIKTPEIEIQPEFVPQAYPELTWNPNGIQDNIQYTGELTSVNFCRKLQACVVRSALTGTPCEVGLYSYSGKGLNDTGIAGTIPLLNGMIANCPASNLYRTVAPGVGQSVCRFEMTGINKKYVSDTKGLSFDSCILDTDNFAAYGDQVVTETFSSNVYNYISPNYFTSTSYPSSFSNGPGMLRLVVNSKINNGVCTFSAYTCVKPALGTDKYSSTFRVYEILKDLEMRDIGILPYWIRNATSSASVIGSRTPKLYYWATFQVSLDTNYSVGTIIDAVKQGLYDNEERKAWAPLWYQTVWNISKSSLTSSAGGRCWSTSYDTLLDSSSESDKMRALYYNCGTDDVCNKGNVTINVAIRFDWQQYRAYDRGGSDPNTESCRAKKLLPCTSDTSYYWDRCCDQGDRCVPPLPKLSDESTTSRGDCTSGNSNSKCALCAKPAYLSLVVSVCGT